MSDLPHVSAVAVCQVEARARRGRLLLGVSPLMLAVCLVGSPVSAAEDATASGATVEELIVTAAKRAENLQDVPLSVGAYTGETLQDRNVSSLQDLVRLDPSVNFRTSTSPNVSAFAIRGVGTASFSSGIEQSVSTVLDGVVLGDPSGVATLADVDHVEVLRGPQGMLYGKNASSGVVSIFTRNPVLGRHEGEFHGKYGENDELVAQAIVNVPLGETLAARLVLTHRELDGWITAPALGGRAENAIDIDSISAKLLWQPSDNLRFILNGGASYTDEFCCSYTVRLAPNPTRAVGLSNAAFGVIAGPKNFEAASDSPSNGYGRLQNVSLTAEYDWNGFQITSITAYNKSKRRNFFDADVASFNFANDTGQRIDFRTTSQELRLVSPLSETFDYVVGLYYSHQDNLGLIAQQGTFTAPLAGTFTTPATAFTGSSAGEADVNGDSYAVFGQGAFHFNRQLSLRVGGRLTRDELKLNYRVGTIYNPALPLQLGAPAPVTPPAVPPFASFNYVGYDGPYVTPCFTQTNPAVVSGTRRPNCFPGISQKVSETNLSWRVTLDNQFTPDMMGYLTVARGYKGPGFSALTLSGAALALGAIDQAIRPEIPTSYEAGLKSSFFDRRLVVNVAAFLTDYKDYQAQVQLPIGLGTSATTVTKILNAGSVHSRGVELQVIAAPADGLTLNVGATYLDNEYGDFPGVPCWAHTVSTPPYPAEPPQPGCGVAPNLAGTVNAKGNRLAGSPEFQVAAVASYERPNFIGSLTGHFSATWNWQSDVNYNPNGDPLTVQDAFGVLGGQIGLETADGRLRVSLYATNILNKHWVSSITPYPVQTLNPGGYTQYFGPESFRHVGIALDAKF